MGHNIEAHPLPDDWSSPLSDSQVDQLFAQDLQEAQDGLFQALPWAQGLDEVRQAVLVDLCFNMGLPTLLQFHHTLGFIQEGNWQAAANGLATSLWARQVPIRAKEDEAMILSGEWPA